jgi:hypothetical protein
MIEWANVYFEHDLAVSLNAPLLVKTGTSTLLNATVYNRGLNDETNVQLQLLINGAVVKSTSIPWLSMGAYLTLSYSWTPTVNGVYNVTAYSPPVENETNLKNNRAIQLATVTQPLISPLEGQYANYTIYYTDPTTGTEVRSGQWNFTYLSYISPYQINVTVWLTEQSGSYNYTQVGWLIVNVFTRMVEQDSGIYWSGMWFPGWIETNVTIGSTVNLLWGNAAVVGNDVIYVGGRPIDCWDIELESSGYAYSFYYDKASGLWIGMRAQSPYEVADLRLEETNIPIGFAFAHDLTLTIRVDSMIPMNESAIVNATVYNTGLNNEAHILLELLINGTVVDQLAVDELLVNQYRSLCYGWIPTSTGTYNVTAYAQPVAGEEYTLNNVATRSPIVFYYSRLYVSQRWVGGGVPMSWHADDASWQYTLPFDFPFYSIYYKTIYISSNGLITFLAPDSSCGNSIPALAQKLAIAPAWDDWVTYDQYEIYVWQNSSHVGIRWYVRTYGSSTIANFEAILNIDGVIQFNYEYNDGPISATIGISNGAGHILAEDATSLNYYSSILFLPFQAGYDVAITNVVPSAHQALAGESVNITVVTENQGAVAESFNVSLYASPLNSSKIYFDPSDYFLDAASAAVGYRFNVTLRVHNVEDLACWQVRMYYNDSIINVTRWFEPTWDPEYVFYGRSTMALPTPPDYVYDHWGPGTGSAMVCSMLFPWPPEQPSFYGDGKLCIFEFEVLAVPSVGQNYSCSLNVDDPDTCYANPEFEFLGFDVYENGYYWVGYGQPPPSAKYLIGTEHIVDLAPGANVSLTFTWNTTNVPPHDYVIWAEADTIPGEIDTADNIFHDGTIKIIKASVAAFTYSPVPAIKNTPVTFNASASTPNGGYITGFTWDFGDGNITATADPVITHVYALYGTYNVTLTVQDSEGLTDSTWQLVEVGRHDVAVTEVVSYRAWVYQGNSVNINVTVLNKGDFAENVTVTLYYNITANKIIGTQYNITLFPGQNQTLFFVWDTTGVEYCHNYTITAVATIPLDNNPADNTLDNVYIKVRIIGDLNGDGKVDIQDLAMASAAFGSYPGHPRWDPRADINKDNRIDIQDIARVSANFGKTSS